MKKQLLTYSLILLLVTAMAFGIRPTRANACYEKKVSVLKTFAGLGFWADTVKVPTAPALTDSTALLSIKDINEVLKYLSDQDIKPSSFLLFKGAIDQLIQYRIKEFNKPKKL